jgi:hypothetical protein
MRPRAFYLSIGFFCSPKQAHKVNIAKDIEAQRRKQLFQSHTAIKQKCCGSDSGLSIAKGLDLNTP